MLSQSDLESVNCTKNKLVCERPGLLGKEFPYRVAVLKILPIPILAQVEQLEPGLEPGLVQELVPELVPEQVPELTMAVLPLPRPILYAVQIR